MKAQIGKSIQDLDTPALLLDFLKLTENIGEMAAFARQNNLRLRPHIKTHKSTEIARLQVESGAVGITTAKIAEAEVMAAAGINDILIAFPISGEQKINRIMKLLAKNVNLKVGVDSIAQIQLLQKGLEHSGYSLEVWIKVNSGLNRCGVEPGNEAVQLARAIAIQTQLKLGGIFTHAGHAYAARSLADIEQIGLQEGKAVAESAGACEQAGIPIAIRSVGSTPTYKIAGKVDGINEIRPGNAVFFDMIQTGLGVTGVDRCALSVLVSVAGVYNEQRIVFDAGSKTLCLDKGAHGSNTVTGFGHIIGHPEIILERLSEEHGVGIINGSTDLKIGDRVEIIPNHACTVANQFGRYNVHMDGKVIDFWEIDARGMNT